MSLEKSRLLWIRFGDCEKLLYFDTVKSKIVAFYEGDIERRPLAKALGQYVPAFMVPNVFRQVESMPLTKNGKIDRKALTAMYQEEKK